jgi:hypothetical protein
MLYSPCQLGLSFLRKVKWDLLDRKAKSRKIKFGKLNPGNPNLSNKYTRN